MASNEIQLMFVRSTKGTHVYGNDSNSAPIPTLYIKHAALPEKPPKSIKSLIEWVE